MIIQFKQTALGNIGIAEENSEIIRLVFPTDPVSREPDNKTTPYLREAFRQLDAYLSGDLKIFSLPLAPKGTAFQTLVWDLLRKVPYGQTATYRDIASAAGNGKACRAVGLANNKNPIPIFIPCHRIIGADGKLTGYRGGLDMKRRLLDLESGHGLFPLRPD